MCISLPHNGEEAHLSIVEGLSLELSIPVVHSADRAWMDGRSSTQNRSNPVQSRYATILFQLTEKLNSVPVT